MRIAYLCFVLFFVPQNVLAFDLSVNLGIGPTYFPPSTTDGTWWQQSFAHSFKTVDLGMKAGLGLNFTPEWSLDVNYIRLGSTAASTDFVMDPDYDPVRHRCINNCSTPLHLRTTDTWQGGELVLKRKFHINDWTPFLNGGFGIVHHDILGQVSNGTSVSFQGNNPVVIGGAGLCYKWVCGEVNYYYGFDVAKNCFPIAKSAVSPMLSLRIPLPF